MFTSKQ
jgi:hypothetical protein